MMNSKTLIQATFAAMLGAASSNVIAAAVPTFPMSINAGTATYDSDGWVIDVPSGSWFAVDFNADGRIAGLEKTALSQGDEGLVIGRTTSPGASHDGAPTANDFNTITAPWLFFGATGSDYLTSPITGSTTAGLDFSGWMVTWNGMPGIALGSGAWGTGFSDGVAHFAWNDTGLVVIDYRATTPLNDSFGLGGTRYALHLEGYFLTPEGQPLLPSLVPEASVCGMMLAGLGLIVLARRGKRGEWQLS